MMRLGMVESAATPPVINQGYRSSFNCETVFGLDSENGNNRNHGVTNTLRSNASVWLTDRSRDNVDSLCIPGSQRPLTQVTRSSGITTSDLSGLLDFPAPPKNSLSQYIDPHSILDSYFHKLEAKGTRSHSRSSRSSSRSRASSLTKKHCTNEPPVGLSSTTFCTLQQVGFGDNQDAGDLANSLSSPCYAI